MRGIRKPIALVDGARLAGLMIEHGVGVRKDGPSGRIRLDEGYFMRLRGAGDRP